MNSKHFKRLWAFLTFTLMLLSLSGCVAEKQSAMNDQQLFDSVRAGMSRRDVEKLLGKPVLEVGSEVYYGKPPKTEKWQSPPAPASISVVYSTDNLVASKKFYGGSN